MGGLNINKRRFMITGSVGFGILAVLLALLIATGSVFAAIPMTGMGGFEVSATRISGTGFELIPAVTDINGEGTNPESLWPAAQNYLATTTIDGLKITKTLDIGKLMPGKKCEIVVSAANGVTGEGVLMYLTNLTADSASFTSLEMDENMPVAHPHKYKLPGSTTELTLTPSTGAEIGQKAPNMELINPKITTHYMKNDKITIPGMKVSLNII